MRVPKTILLVALVGLISSTGWTQYGAPGGNWPHYAGDHGSTKYSALSQIDARNFSDLEVLWRWTSVDEAVEDEAPFKPFHLRATPLVINGVAYMSTGLSQVAAIDLHSGETLWVRDPKSYERGMVTHGSFNTGASSIGPTVWKSESSLPPAAVNSFRSMRGRENPIPNSPMGAGWIC